MTYLQTNKTLNRHPRHLSLNFACWKNILSKLFVQSNAVPIDDRTQNENVLGENPNGKQV